MHAIARASRPIALAALVAALLLPVAAGPAAAAAFSVRLEAGPRHAVTFSASWRVTGRRTVTLASPATVTGSRRVAVPDRGVYLRISGGTLAGWWVRENRLSYRPGYAGIVTWQPARAVTLAAGRYELYAFDAAGTMTEARGLEIAAATPFHVDRSAAIDGRPHVRVADGPWAGWWLPGSSAPTRIGCSAGAPPTGTTARIVRSVPGATGEMALTFDMGGRLTPALRILRLLELERVCATILPTADAARTDTGRQVMAEVAAHPELFELGNHTVHHCNLRDGGGGSSACPATRPSAAFVAAELQDADAIISGLAGPSTVPYWRPPYGAVDKALAADAAAAGYPYTLLWSTDTIDWRPVSDGGPTAAGVAAKVVAGERDGGIVLMHLGGYKTRNALPAVIHGLRAAGSTLTSISALYRSGH